MSSQALMSAYKKSTLVGCCLFTGGKKRSIEGQWLNYSLVCGQSNCTSAHMYVHARSFDSEAQTQRPECGGYR